MLNGGKSGDLGTEEVRRVTRVQLLDHGSVNEPLMCFVLGSPLCSQQDQRYSVLPTVGSPVMAASSCRVPAASFSTLLQIASGTCLAETSLAISLHLVS